MNYFNSLQTPRLSIIGPVVAAAAFKWGHHAPGVRLFEANTSAKFIGTATAAALGTAPFIIGTNTGTWEIRVNIPGTIIIGIATALRSLSSIAPGPDALFREIVAAEGTIVRVTLSITTLTITAAATTTTSPLAPYAALTMYPFAAAAGTFGLSFATTSGATFTVNAASELTITTAATRVNFETGGAGLRIDGKAATPDALPLTGGDMIGDINMIPPATITGVSYMTINGVEIGATPRRIFFTTGAGILQGIDNLTNSIRIMSVTDQFMRFDSTIGTPVTNILTRLNMNTQPILSVAPSAIAGSFYETVAAAAYPLVGTILSAPTNITLSAARVGGIVTLNWTTIGPLAGTLVTSFITAPAFVLPLTMRPAAAKSATMLITNAGVLTAGYITILSTGLIEFHGPTPTGLFTVTTNIGITGGATTWTV